MEARVFDLQKNRPLSAVLEFSFVFGDFYLLLSTFQIVDFWEEERHLSEV
jgi:hypothetical protein